MSEDYRVQLEVYNGPLDLLLYLIRREEVDVHDIPVARIAEQYIKYVGMLQEIDPNLAGDFLVLAATLMEVKTRMLLPAAEIEDGEEESLSVDPRSELVRQLLQYKAFKDAADELEISREIQSQKFPRVPVKIEEDTEKSVELEDVQIWDLFDAFSKVMDSIGHLASDHEVIYDDTPIELHQTDIIDRIKREGKLTFTQVFEGRTSRSEIVGLFLAVLELVRQQKVFTLQGDNFGEIVIEENPNPPTEEEIAQQDREFDAKKLEEETREAEKKSAAKSEPQVESEEESEEESEDEFDDDDDWDEDEFDDEDDFEDDDEIEDEEEDDN